MYNKVISMAKIVNRAEITTWENIWYYAWVIVSCGLLFASKVMIMKALNDLEKKR